MKHSGKARQAGLKLVFWSLLLVVGVMAVGIIAHYVAAFVRAIEYLLPAVWACFAIFTFYFFRDPDPKVPAGAGLVVSPGHGRIDVIEDAVEKDFLGGPCKRISMFLSPLDVHVQNAPVSGRVALVKYQAGHFRAAMRTECGLQNENALIGIESSEVPGEKIGVRLVAGFLARRILTWAREGDTVERGERISMIQFGSRCDVYLPAHLKIKVRLGEKVRGGESVLAARE